MGGRVGKHRLFRRSRGIHRIRDSGFPQRGRPVSPEIPIPAGNHPEPQLLCAAQGGVLRFLPGQDAGPLGRAQRRPPEAGPVGAGGAAEGRHYPEHRRPAPEGRQPGGAGASRQCAAELLREVRGLLRAGHHPAFHRRAPVPRLRRGVWTRRCWPRPFTISGRRT